MSKDLHRIAPRGPPGRRETRGGGRRQHEPADDAIGHLENAVVFGTVNANRLHFELAAEALGAANPSWLESLLTREVPVDRWEPAFERGPDNV